MVMRPFGPVAVRITLDECRREAQKCIDEAADAEDQTMTAGVGLAERLRDQFRWPLSSTHPARR